jgi:hypothetical protein
LIDLNIKHGKKMNKLAVILLGLVFSASSFAVLMTEVSDNAYITVGGYDIAWVAPVSHVSGNWQPIDYSYQSQFGWSPLTLAIYNEIGGLDATDFAGTGYNAVWNGSQYLDPSSGGRASHTAGLNSIAIATAWFSNQHLHIDFSQAIGGNAWSGLDFEGSSCPNSCNESLAFRVSQDTPVASVPAPATLALLGLGLIGIRLSRKNKTA